MGQGKDSLAGAPPAPHEGLRQWSLMPQRQRERRTRRLFLSRPCDSLIITTKYDPTAALFRLLPYLVLSCPFMVYHEFLELMLHTFHALQNYYVPEIKKGGGDNDVDNGEEDDAVGDDDNGNHENSGEVPIDIVMTDDATR
jgi:hypothetical protein